MSHSLQSTLDKLKERIEYFGFVFDPCDTVHMRSKLGEHQYTIVTFYHPANVLLSGSFSVTTFEDEGITEQCSISPFKIYGDFQHCYDALWVILKLWKEYGVNTNVSWVDTAGGEGE